MKIKKVDVCQRCGTNNNLTKHHYPIPKCKKGNRIIILCRDCHDYLHNINSIPKNKKWSNEEIDKLMLLYKKRFDYGQLSQELGRSRSACYTMVHNVKMFVDNCSQDIRKLNYVKESKEVKQCIKEK